jgi:hypothetical protein
MVTKGGRSSWDIFGVTSAGAENAIDCEASAAKQWLGNLVGDEGLASAETLAGLENSLNCAGLCQKSNFFTFSSVGNGPPS